MTEGLLYAEVVVNRPASPSDEMGSAAGFTYAVPPALQGRLRRGQLVRVPFGDVRQVGMVMELSSAPPQEGLDIRPIEAILDEEPALNRDQRALARWLARSQMAPLSRCVGLMLPPGLFPPPEILVEATERGGEPLENEQDRHLLALLREKGPLTLRGLRRRVDAPWPSTHRRLRRLMRQGLVRRRAGDAHLRVRARQTDEVRLEVPWQEVPARLARLGRESGPARALLALMQSEDPLPTVETVYREAQCGAAQLRSLERRGWVRVLPARTWVDLTFPRHEVERVLEGTLSRAPAQSQALQLVAESPGPVDREDLMGAGASPAAIRSLESRGLVRQVEEAASVMLLLGPEEALDALAQLRGLSRGLEVLRLLREEGEPLWIGGVYAQTSADRTVLRTLEEGGLISLEQREAVRDPLAGMTFTPEEPPPLTEHQEAVWRKVRQALQAWLGGHRPKDGSQPPAFLLHGVTGSGKTEIYLRALDLALRMGRQAVVLVPEIALTPQTIRRFAVRFPGRVTTLHSELSRGERYDQWRRVRDGQVDVVVGPRSALFAPLPRLGLIIMDEEHETSYKEARPPCYHARAVALERARLTGSAVILGSATPSVESYYQARKGRFRLLSLPQRIFRAGDLAGEGVVSGPLPPVQVVDMRQELRAGNRSMFSRALQEALTETLSAGQQAILFLNRRGTATFVLCRDCGHVLMCPRCELPLTYHRQGESLRCHHCGFQVPPPDECPACGSHRIRYFGVGTQQVEQAVRERWPEARLLRWDLDTTRTRGAHQRIMRQFAGREADILVGTQMVAKGLDLPWVTLVGVVAADTALHLPDFRAAERTFQLLTQVAGRAGRSPLGGQVVVQTYSPDHYAIRAASRHDFAAFYRRELAFRREMGYPPFGRLARLLFVHSRWAVCQQETDRVAAWLEGRLAELGLPGSALVGPVPCFFLRERGRFRWHLVVRAADPVRVLRGVPLKPGWRVDVDPVDLL